MALWMLATALVCLGAPSYRTANFVVQAPTARLATMIGEHAEKQRKKLALAWLGHEMPTWEQRCTVRVRITDGEVSGFGTFMFEEGKCVSQEIKIDGPLDRVLHDLLAHDIAHSVLATRLGAPPPRWADEGMATLAGKRERKHMTRLTKQFVKEGRALRLKRLFDLKGYPSDVMVFLAQSCSVTQFLVDRRGRDTFVAFVERGTKGGWDEAVQCYYGFKSVEDLESAWVKSLNRPRAK